MIRGSRILLNMSREEQRLQEVWGRCGKVNGWSCSQERVSGRRVKAESKICDVGMQVVEAEVTSTPGSSMGYEVEKC